MCNLSLPCTCACKPASVVLVLGVVWRALASPPITGAFPSRSASGEHAVGCQQLVPCSSWRLVLAFMRGFPRALAAPATVAMQTVEHRSIQEACLRLVC